MAADVDTKRYCKMCQRRMARRGARKQKKEICSSCVKKREQN